MNVNEKLEKLETQVEAAEKRWREGWKQGPNPPRWEVMPARVGDQAPDLMLAGSTGNQAQLSSLWADGPALILFWRHYGCGCGVDRAKRLANEYSGHRRARGAGEVTRHA